jgi:Fe-S-cluster-containing dehydrogenase component
VPMQCMQCGNAACMNICPTQAIYVDPETNAKIKNPDKCIGCRMCMIACPFGAISVDPLTHKIVKCDLCLGDRPARNSARPERLSTSLLMRTA